MHRFAFGLVLALSALGGPCLAQGLFFEQDDWQLVCDNTRTCRAAGYQAEGVEPAVSVLLTREAGRGHAVTGQVMLGPLDASSAKLPPLTLQIGGKALGPLAVTGAEEAAVLSPPQVAAVLDALVHTADIAVAGGGQRWHLSGAGAAAALLKMDEAQGRLGTPGAVVRKGTRREDAVLPPLPKPAVQAVALPPAHARDARLVATILPRLRPSPKICPDYSEPAEPAKIWRLDGGKLLFSMRCWLAAYNAGYGYWVVNDKPPYQPVLVTTDGTDFEPETSRIIAMQKGRGPADCFSMEQWVWDGARFVHTASGTTGLCRGVTAGGPWDLPTLVTDVRPPADRRTTEEKRK
ncbi:DUF1176 domain-containing protein [Ramlibacter sp.]|uniref:DUF1176 domain-containing protein n=1 Tax=Ramlibacter sp. TaxID=1917967 RepID=UPI0026271451|nr:DUF1176 domain-containing protein [Ramlibacter sp.]MDB5957233.1 regulatory protein rpfI [Ramlibacter sp.]